VKDALIAYDGPRIVDWSDHALVKAEMLNITRADVERVVLESHQRRTHNSGAEDWLVSAGRLTVAYNHPHRDDALTALVVTLWRHA
jgi:hypothetical protein